jgi:hypothetical protein
MSYYLFTKEFDKAVKRVGASFNVIREYIEWKSAHNFLVRRWKYILVTLVKLVAGLILYHPSYLYFSQGTRSFLVDFSYEIFSGDTDLVRGFLTITFYVGFVSLVVFCERLILMPLREFARKLDDKIIDFIYVLVRVELYSGALLVFWDQFVSIY